MCTTKTRPAILNEKGEFTYIDRVTKDAKTGEEKHSKVIARKTDGPFANIRTSNHIKEHFSNLLFELFDPLSLLIQNQLISLGVKTITEPVVLSVIEAILVNGQTATESLVYTRTQVVDSDVLKAWKAEQKKAKEEKRAPTDTRTEDQLPKKSQLNITKQLVVAGSRFDALQKILAERRKLWPVEEPKKAVVAPVVAP
jgi:hypothetical protein